MCFLDAGYYQANAFLISFLLCCSVSPQWLVSAFTLLWCCEDNLKESMSGQTDVSPHVKPASCVCAPADVVHSVTLTGMIDIQNEVQIKFIYVTLLSVLYGALWVEALEMPQKATELNKK